ncbi:MAG: serine protein kinase [Planctomycetota bacterium]|nr:MAG: serine protein kinase [Planctomycetota bacterium]
MDERHDEHVRTPRELSLEDDATQRADSNYIELARAVDREQEWQDLHWQGSLAQYLELVRNDPRLARNAYQRLHDAVLSFGVERAPAGSGRPAHYRFFDDSFDGGRDAVFGIEHCLADLVAHLRAAAHGLGPERRVLLLHGPVGSAKSTIARLLKRGLQHVSRSNEGAVYTFGWRIDGELHPCPMNEDPLHLLPEEVQRTVFADLNRRFGGEYELRPTGQLCPFCRHHQEQLLRASNGDFAAVEAAIEVRRFVLSEADRVGIGTFQPKDEKNQDSTELTGDINYRRIAEFGSDSDPRAFNFDGEFHVANRGMIEFIEILKLDVAFLYDLLGATQEQTVKPKKFAQTDIDEVILGHTNSPEYRRLQGNELMEAFRDRTCKIDIPYNRRLSQEVRIYRKSFGTSSCAGKHLAPLALDAAAMWAVLTRLHEPKNAGLSLLQKMELYDGHRVPGFMPSASEELRAEAPEEGLTGISPRYVQDRVAAALVAEDAPSCLLPFDVLDSLESGLRHHPLMENDDERRRIGELVGIVREEIEERIKTQVREAVVADSAGVERLCANYVDSVAASVSGHGSADERLMRSIEEKIGVTEARKSDFRREIVNYIEALSSRGESFTPSSNPRLRSALELKLFEDTRDTFQLTAGDGAVVDRDASEKVAELTGRLIRGHGYCERCAARTLEHVSGLFARGDAKLPAPEEEV